MTRAIWKFTLTGPKTVVSMPKGSLILSTQVQEEQSPKGHLPQIWALCDPEQTEFVDRTFFIVETGELISYGSSAYAGTVQMPGGLVWHVLEEK